LVPRETEIFKPWLRFTGMEGSPAPITVSTAPAAEAIVGIAPETADDAEPIPL
jgi:hypothetical protein